MKKVVNLLLSFALLFVLTGCVSVRVNMEVKSDKSFTFGYTSAIDTSYFENEDEALQAEESFKMRDEVREAFTNAGYTSSPYEEGTLRGLTISKTFTNIDNLVNKGETFDFIDWTETANEDGMFTREGNVYKANWIFDLAQEETGEGTETLPNEEDSNEMIASIFDMTYTVVLPQPSISNNATTVSEDGKTLTWKLNYGEVNTVQYEFGFPEEAAPVVPTPANNVDDNIIYYLIAGGVLLVSVVIIVLFMASKSKKSKNADNATESAQSTQTNPVVEEVVPVQPIAEEVITQPEVAPVLNQHPKVVSPVEPVVQPTVEPPIIPVQPAVEEVTPQPEVVSSVEPMVQPTVEPTVTPVQPVVEEVTPQPEVAPILNQQPEINVEPQVETIQPEINVEPVEPFFKTPEVEQTATPVQNTTISLDELMNQSPVTDNNQQ